MKADPVSRLIFELSKLPGIGEKSATRLAYHLLRQSTETNQALSEAIMQAKTRVKLCSSCFSFTDQEFCSICSSPHRSIRQICVVERPSDVTTLEGAGIFQGQYHVLHGLLSPLDGIGPDDLKIRDLIVRIQQKADDVQEIILGLNPSVEGEATGLYLTKLLRPVGIKITQLASGIPVGGQLEFADRQTLGRAFSNRVELGGEPLNR